MLKNRLIPVVLMRGGVCVQSKGFRRYQRLGNPTTIVERLSDWASDELIYLDISSDDEYDLGRDDLRDSISSDPLDILRQVASRCFMPLTFGGRIRSIEDVAVRVRYGADKVSLNSAALENPGLIEQVAQRYGSQCCVVCIDARRDGDEWQVYGQGGTLSTGLTAAQWAQEAVKRGAGELLVQSIDEDGSGRGYDLRLIQSVTRAVDVPVIALGGAGDWQHMADAIQIGGARAVAAANIFNYSENSVFKAKKHLYDNACNVRRPSLGVGSPAIKAA